MKRGIVFLSLLAISVIAQAQGKVMKIYHAGNAVYEEATTSIDSIVFANTQTGRSLEVHREGKVAYGALTPAIDSIVFVNDNHFIYDITEIPLTADMLSTNAQEPTEGDIAYLVDRNAETFFHSKWSSPMALPHWIDVAFPGEIACEGICFRYKNRHNRDNNAPESMEVFGSVDGSVFDLLAKIEGITATARGTEYVSELISFEQFETKFKQKPKVLRFSTLSIPTGEPWFSMAEFWLYGYTTTVANPETDVLAEDVRVELAGATASSFQTGEGIERSFDNDQSTLYHSLWSGNLPVTLVYTFENKPSIQYFIYYPRQDGNKNGIFKQIEVTAAIKTKSNHNLGTFDMPGTASSCRIEFPAQLIDPEKITIKVTQSAGNSAVEENRFASCAEIEFFGKDSATFYYPLYFTDITCSRLRPGITKEAIDNIEPEFYRDLATKLFNGRYDQEFRVQTYDSYRHPDIDAKELKTSTYGLRDNPTGIAAAKDEEIVILAGDIPATNLSVLLQDPESNGIGGVSFSIHKGINRFTAPFAGLMYVMYYTETGEEPPVKLNIVTGSVNGYFDSSKHTKDDWTRLINGAVFKHFDLKGKYATLTFETNAYRNYVPDGKALADLYDKLVYDEQEFMGLVKYNRQYRNRAHFQVMYTGYMHATGYHTAYNASTQGFILDVDKLTGKGMSYSEYIWGPAHELGHTHQTRPGLKWVGTTEVTNNIHSAYIQTKWTGKCRLQEESMVAEGGYANRYEKAFAEILDAGISYIEHDDPFCKLIPFWQLKLYMIDVLGKTDFYKDIYEWVRVNPDLNNGASQLQFVEFACRSANLDLTDFFEKWGFLTPLDLMIEDYTQEAHIVTQAMIDKTKANIAARAYPKPDKDFTRITEATKAGYQ